MAPQIFPYFHPSAVFQNFPPFSYISLKPDWGRKAARVGSWETGVEGRGYMAVIAETFVLRSVSSLLLILLFKQPYSKECYNKQYSCFTSLLSSR